MGCGNLKVGGGGSGQPRALPCRPHDEPLPREEGMLGTAGQRGKLESPGPALRGGRHV